MLQEKLNQCRILISEVKQNKQLDEENKNIAKRNNTFFDAYSNYLVPLIKSYLICKSCDHISFPNSLIEELNEWMRNTEKVFEQNAVVNPVKYQTNYKNLYEKFQKEWETQTSAYISNKKEDLVILRLVSNDKLEIQKILQCMNNYSKWPLDETTIEQFLVAEESAEKILEQSEFDNDIAQFLKKVKDKQASILDLTDPIIDWIRRENLSNNIMLSIRN